MFDALSERFERLGASLRSRGRLSDADLDEALAEVRAALLEADVELGVVRAFLDAVRERLSGEVLSQSLTPGQQVIKAVHEQLVEVLGGSALKVTYASRPPTVILLAGLQGAGKTTTAAKKTTAAAKATVAKTATKAKTAAKKTTTKAKAAAKPARSAPHASA